MAVDEIQQAALREEPMVQREEANKKDLEGGVEAVSQRRKIWQHWPTGLTALAVIILSWFGIYLLWRGIAPLIGF